MASSGVRESVYLTITSTFVGVSGMLFFIILPNVGIYAIYCVLFLNMFWPTFLDVLCDRCCFHFWFETNGCFSCPLMQCHCLFLYDFLPHYLQPDMMVYCYLMRLLVPACLVVLQYGNAIALLWIAFSMFEGFFPHVCP